MTITASGAPAFPYNLGRSLYGDPTGNTVASITETVTTNFVGGANADLQLSPPVVTNNSVTLVWSATEGGTYRVESSNNLVGWITNATGIAATFNHGTVAVPGTSTNQFFRVTRTALATYDSN